MPQEMPKVLLIESEYRLRLRYKSLFKKGSQAELKLKKDTRSGKMKLRASSGWKITNVRWSKNTEPYAFCDFQKKRGSSTVTMRLPKMLKSETYDLTITAVNQKTKGTAYLLCWIAP